MILRYKHGLFNFKAVKTNHTEIPPLTLRLALLTFLTNTISPKLPALHTENGSSRQLAYKPRRPRRAVATRLILAGMVEPSSQSGPYKKSGSGTEAHVGSQIA